MLPTDYTFQTSINKQPWLITKDEGISLVSLLSNGRITPRQCDMYMNKARKELEKHNFEHHDLHPRNIILNDKTRKCTVIDFEIKNKFLNSLMVVSFQFGLEKIADAFQKRAEELFGNSKN